MKNKRRAGRPPGRTGTREAIVAAARDLFSDQGFGATSLREVARAAEVDASLIRHYFPTKEALLLEAVRLPFDPSEAVAAIQAAPPHDLGRAVASTFLALWDPPERRAAMRGLLGAALESDRAAALLREVVGRIVMPALARSGEPDGPRIEAALAGSQMIGLALARYVVGVEPLASASPEAVVEAVAPALQRYLQP